MSLSKVRWVLVGMLLFYISAGSARGDMMHYPPGGGMPGWLDTLFHDAVMEVGPIIYTSGSPTITLPGPNPGGELGMTYGPSLSGIGMPAIHLDPLGIATLAGIPTGETPPSAEDQEQLRELMVWVMGHEAAHADGRFDEACPPSNPDKRALYCCHVTYTRNVDLPLLCNEICYMKSHNMVADKMCKFYKNFSAKLNDVIKKACGQANDAPLCGWC
jgi:hypothetical protein